MQMYPRIRKPMLSLSVIECLNLKAMDQRRVSYSRRYSQLRWSMKELLVRTKPKDSFALIVSDNSPNTRTTFNPPLYLQANRNYELTMVNLETYYSFANIRDDNNSFKWSVDGGKTWTTLHMPTGCYELKAINAVLIRIHGNSDITILPNVNTLQCILTVVGAKCKVSFDIPNSLASVLGFERSIYGVGRHASETLVNIV